MCNDETRVTLSEQRSLGVFAAVAELTPVRWDVVNAPGVPCSPNIPGGSSASSENVNSADEKRPQ